VLKNKEKVFEDEVKRIEDQFQKKAEREFNKSQELGLKKDDFVFFFCMNFF